MNNFNPNQPWPGWSMPSGEAYNYTPQQNSVPNSFRQAQSAPCNIRGKFADSPSAITPQDVPMDGSVGVYPIRDGSAIYIKAWQQDGTIKTIKYIPEDSVPELSRKITTLEDLEERVKKLESLNRKTSKKKEEVEDES